LNRLLKSTEKEIKCTSCPICHYPQAKIFYVYSYEGNQSEIVECCQCQHWWIDPAPLAQLSLRSMSSVEDEDLFSDKILGFFHRQFIILPEIRWVRKLTGKRGGKVLDIACGTGRVTSVWQNENFDVTGLEASSIRSQICREKYGLNVITGFIENFNSEEKFDVITMRHILEHIGNPIVVLEKVKSLLKDDGILSVTVPNIRSVGRYIFQEKHEWVLPWHLHFYYPKTLIALVERAGFTSLKLYQKPSPLWYPDSLRSVLKENNFIARILAKIPRSFSMALFAPIVLMGVVFGLSDNLTILAKKK